MRVFRLLRVKKQLEQKQVADYAMVPVRDARELLYRMLRGGFLTLQVRPSHVLQSLSGFEACTSSSCPFSCHGPEGRVDLPSVFQDRRHKYGGLLLDFSRRFKGVLYAPDL